MRAPVPVRMPFQGESELVQECQPALGDVLVPRGPFGIVVQGGPRHADFGASADRGELEDVPAVDGEACVVGILDHGGAEVDLVDFVAKLIGLPAVPLSHERRFAQRSPNLLRVGINNNAQIVRHGPNLPPLERTRQVLRNPPIAPRTALPRVRSRSGDRVHQRQGCSSRRASVGTAGFRAGAAAIRARRLGCRCRWSGRFPCRTGSVR